MFNNGGVIFSLVQQQLNNNNGVVFTEGAMPDAPPPSYANGQAVNGLEAPGYDASGQQQLINNNATGLPFRKGPLLPHARRPMPPDRQ